MAGGILHRVFFFCLVSLRGNKVPEGKRSQVQLGTGWRDDVAVSIRERIRLKPGGLGAEMQTSQTRVRTLYPEPLRPSEGFW